MLAASVELACFVQQGLLGCAVRRAQRRWSELCVPASNFQKHYFSSLADCSLLIHFLFAGVKHAPARWYIKGLTKTRRQRFVPSGKRHSIKLAVFIRMGHSPIVVVASQHSSSQDNKADSSSRAATKNANIAWSGARYRTVVQEALLGGGGDSAPTQRSAKVKLVHDRDSCHTSGIFRTFAQANGIELVVLPAKAPDLDPLDYGVFGPVKRAWEKTVWQEQLGWTAQCQLLIQLLKEYDCDAAIASLPGRIHKCIEAQGWHFEG